MQTATTAKYHAGKHGAPLCGARGTGNRSNVICLSPREWNATKAEHRCSKCAAKIALRK